MKKFFITVVVFVFCFSAYAFEFAGPSGSTLDIYTSLRTYGLYEGVDSETTDTDEFPLGIQGNSRLGFIFKKDNVMAQVEYNQPMGNTSTTYNDTGLRLAYFGYTFENSSTLYMGQMATISSTGTKFSRRLYGDSGICGFGGVNELRRPGVKYALNKNFQVQLQTLRDDSSNFTNLYSGTRYSNVTFEEKLPKIEMLYKLDSVPVSFMGAYAMFSLQADDADRSGSRHDFTTSAYHVAFLAAPVIDKVTLKFSGFYSVNGGLYGQVNTGSATSKTPIQTLYLSSNGEDVEDVKTLGGGMSVTYQIDPKSAFEVGGGYQSSSSDMYAQNDNNYGVYMNYNYKLNKYLQITPEIGYYDSMENAAKKGTKPVDDARVIQAGVQLRIDL